MSNEETEPVVCVYVCVCVRACVRACARVCVGECSVGLFKSAHFTVLSNAYIKKALCREYTYMCMVSSTKSTRWNNRFSFLFFFLLFLQQNVFLMTSFEHARTAYTYWTRAYCNPCRVQLLFTDTFAEDATEEQTKLSCFGTAGLRRSLDNVEPVSYTHLRAHET